MDNDIAAIDSQMRLIIFQLRQEKIGFFTGRVEIDRIFRIIAKLGFLAIKKTNDSLLMALKDPWIAYQYGIPELVAEGMYSFVVDITKKMGGTDPYTFASKALAADGSKYAKSALIELSKSGQKDCREIAKDYLDTIGGNI